MRQLLAAPPAPALSRPARAGILPRLLPRALCLASALGCAALSFAIVFVLRLGPVIAILDAEHGHGVHSGDLFAVPLAASALLFGLLSRSPAVTRLSAI